MGLINKPHDKFFKETFSDANTAKDFMVNYLPKDVLELVDLNSLKPQKDSYIEEDLKETFSDLLFQTKISNEESYIYFLFEHKSYPANKVAIQLLRYMLNIWNDKSCQKQKDKLPIIIPLVVYHGKAMWNAELKLSELIQGFDKLPEGVKKYVPDYEYILYNISKYSDDEIKGNVKLRIFLKVLRDIFGKDYDGFIETIGESIKALDKLEEQNKGIEYFETFIRYIMNARNDIKISKVYDIAKDISVERSEKVMTIAEELINQGMEKGIEQGEKQRAISIAKEMLADGEHLEKIIKYSKLPESEVLKLKESFD